MLLNIVVCVKITFDISLIGVDSVTRAPIFRDVPFKISDFDLNAIEEAVRLKERHGGKVTSVSVGPIERKDSIKRALAMGVDEAYFVAIDQTTNLDSLQVAEILHAVLRRLSADTIICGEGSVDEYNSQIGPRLSELLGIPVVAYASKVEITDRTVTAERSLERIKQTVRCNLPLILSVGSEINEPRFPTLLQIMGASKKPIKVLTTNDLEVSLEETPALSILDISAPESRRRRIRIEGDAETAARKLVANLVQEGVLT